MNTIPTHLLEIAQDKDALIKKRNAYEEARFQNEVQGNRLMAAAMERGRNACDELLNKLN